MRNSLIILLGILASTATWAASVSQVKNNKALLQLDAGEAPAPGTEYFVVAEGKKIGLLVIRQIRGNKAIAEITKGRANPGDQTQLRAATPAPALEDAPAAEVRSNSAPTAGRRKKGAPVGALAGYSMNSMALEVQSTSNPNLRENATLTGTNFSLKGFYDYELSPTLTVRGASGLEGFAVQGSTSAAICDSGTSTTCTVSFNYLAFEGSLHYNYLTGKNKAWVGVGYSLLLTMSKTNTIPNLSTASATNQTILFGTGVDWSLSRTAFVPVVLEYGMFPGSSNVTASAINMRAGYGFYF